MLWKSFVTAIGNVAIATFAAVTVAFVVLNLIVGCESWDQPQCITIGELIGGEF